MTQKISYSAVVLTLASQQILKDKWNSLNKDEGWTTFCHHATINMGELPPELKPLIGKEVILTIVNYRENEKVAAFLVEKPAELASFIKNEHFHITAGTNPAVGGKPVMSNNLLSNSNLTANSTNSFELVGIVQEISY